MKVKVKQLTKHVSVDDIARAEAMILMVPAGTGPRKNQDIPYYTLLKQRLKSQGGKQWGLTVFSTDLPNDRGTRCAVFGAKSDHSQFQLLSAARQAVKHALSVNPKTVLIVSTDADNDLAERCVEALVTACLAATAPPTQFKSKPGDKIQLTTLAIYGIAHHVDLQRVQATASGNNLARKLTCLPPNRLTPSLYRKEVSKLAKQYGWSMRFYNNAALKRKSAGAFLAVAQAHPDGDAGIIHLRYHPAKAPRHAKSLALVGKGVCFDTGGNNLKPAKSMHGMHEDMEGSAVALGTLLALSTLGVNFHIDCWLALTENMIGPLAYKQNDVITAADGTTIEVIHTDAEGRLILADALVLAVQQKPTFIIDYATLTGACVYALSTRYSGAFTNRLDLMNEILTAGRNSGERVWLFPNDEDYNDELISEVADIKQCTLGGKADHILAYQFLKRFVGDTPWLHIDLSAGNHKGGLAHIPTDITGFGVHYTVELLLGRKLLEQL